MCDVHPLRSKPAKTSGFTLSDFVHMSKWTHDTLHDPPNELLSFNPFGFEGEQILHRKSRNLCPESLSGEHTRVTFIEHCARACAVAAARAGRK